MMVENREPGSGRVSRRVLRGFDRHRFKQLRKSTMTMSDLARLSGVTSSTIYAWEAGTYTPQVDKLAAVMRVLGHPIEYVVEIPADERYPGDWRVLRGLTQPQLAASASIATARLQRIECGETEPTDAQVEALAQLLETAPEEYRAAWRRALVRPPGEPV